MESESLHLSRRQLDFLESIEQLVADGFDEDFIEQMADTYKLQRSQWAFKMSPQRKKDPVSHPRKSLVSGRSNRIRIFKKSRFTPQHGRSSY